MHPPTRRDAPRTEARPLPVHVACHLLLAVVGTLAASACSTPPPEQRLRETIVQLQSAVEQGDASAMEELLADDFIGPDGLDRAGARRLATLYFLREKQVAVVSGPLEITLQPMHATVRTTVALRGGQGLLPDSASLRAFESGWRLEGDDWKMTSARWHDGR